MLKGKQQVEKGENVNFNPFMKGGSVMSRKILAGLVVFTFLLLGSQAIADCGNALSYQVFSNPTVGGISNLNGTTVTAKVYLENSAGMAGASIPLSFGAVGSDIQCTKIDFKGSRVEHFQLYPTIDNQNKRVLIGMIRALDENIDDVLKPGEGLMATLYFSSKSGRCTPDLKITVWPLSGGKLYFDMVGADGYSICGSKKVDAQIPIPVRPGGDAPDPGLVKPSSFNLEQNYPNPFNPETVIKFSLPQDSRVTLRVYNILGQVVNTLVDEVLLAGNHSVIWDGKNSQGSDAASGVYFYRIKADNYESIMKMTLLR